MLLPESFIAVKVIILSFIDIQPVFVSCVAIDQFLVDQFLFYFDGYAPQDVIIGVCSF